MIDTQPGGAVDVHAAADDLLRQAKQHPSGRAASTVVSGPVMRATLIALRAGAELGEHESPPAATLHVLRGRVQLRTAQQSWDLEGESLVPIPSERHAVGAGSDAVVLLTVALR